MLKSCKYCGRVHEASYECDPKRIALKRQAEKRWKSRKIDDNVIFRKSNAWKEKSIDIRKRDKYMCLCCKANIKGTQTQYNTQDLSVHHITPLSEDFSQRLDDVNLISVCPLHHEMCEAGAIDRETQRELVIRSMSESGEDFSEICM